MCLQPLLADQNGFLYSSKVQDGKLRSVELIGLLNYNDTDDIRGFSEDKSLYFLDSNSELFRAKGQFKPSVKGGLLSLGYDGKEKPLESSPTEYTLLAKAV